MTGKVAALAACEQRDRTKLCVKDFHLVPLREKEKREKDDVFILPDMLAGGAVGGLAKKLGGARGCGRRVQGAGQHALS
ncbi:hypothetical protein E2C01_080437 [Portunus trituberculatus]|uniref:Uncharacterized protein n=1 Tax=Portunus trituberculatus TaxID=210409 RepID=A0A5B7IT95_PORTR|nr:hypothetical protein [Portunus trituberculatus]